MHSALFRDEQPLRIRCATVTMLLACQCLAPSLCQIMPANPNITKTKTRLKTALTQETLQSE
jgi:hypothetical protein